MAGSLGPEIAPSFVSLFPRAKHYHGLGNTLYPIETVSYRKIFKVH